MWSSSPYDAPPPFISGEFMPWVSVTSPTLAGTTATSTGSPPLFANSGLPVPAYRPGGGRPDGQRDAGALASTVALMRSSVVASP